MKKEEDKFYCDNCDKEIDCTAVENGGICSACFFKREHEFIKNEDETDF
jgi:hypothetical protein